MRIACLPLADKALSREQGIAADNGPPDTPPTSARPNGRRRPVGSAAVLRIRAQFLRLLRNGFDLAFTVTTLIRYSGPILLAIAAPALVGTNEAQALFVMISVLLLGITIGKLGVDNEILKSLADPDRQVGLRLTLLVWLPVTGMATVFVMMRWWSDTLALLEIGTGTYLLMYAVLFVNGIVAALEKSRGSTRYVQLFEFGAFQFLLFGVLVGINVRYGTADGMLDTAIVMVSIGNGIVLARYILRSPAPFLHRERVGLALIRERANCFVPNMITYVAAWGLLLPLAGVVAEDFAEINAALRIAAISTAIVSVSNLLGIRGPRLSVERSYHRSRRIGLLLLGLSLPAIVVVYAIADQIVPGIPDATDPLVLLIYLIHLISVLIGPALFYANVAGRHREINTTFAILCALIVLIYLLPLSGVVGFLLLLLYVRIFSRLWLSVRGHATARV